MLEDYIQQDLPLIMFIDFESLYSIIQKKDVANHFSMLSVSGQL